MLKNVRHLGEGVVVAPMDPNFGVYTGAFGGWTAAHAMLAATDLAVNEMYPVTMTINYLKGIDLGDVQSMATVRGAAKSTRFIDVATSQDDGLCAVSTVVLAKRRGTEPVVVVEMPFSDSPENIEPLVMPVGPATWIRQYDMRYVVGVPLKPSIEMRSRVWTRLADRQPLSYATLTALADASVPRIFFHFTTPTPIATLAMTVQFHCDADVLAEIGDDFVLIDARGGKAMDGFFDQYVRIWSRAGVLIASSTQMSRYDVLPAIAE
jgi:acyl-CoA thioesterase